MQNHWRRLYRVAKTTLICSTSVVSLAYFINLQKNALFYCYLSVFSVNRCLQFELESRAQVNWKQSIYQSQNVNRFSVFTSPKTTRKIKWLIHGLYLSWFVFLWTLAVVKTLFFPSCMREWAPMKPSVARLFVLKKKLTEIDGIVWHISS